MSLVISIEGQEYLPIRSIPAVTSQVIDQRLLASMIGNYEHWIDGDYREIVTAFLMTVGGKLLPLNHSAFAAAARASLLDDTSQIAPSGCVVPKVAVKEKFDIHVYQIWHRFPSSARPGAIWNEDPVLTPAEKTKIFDGLAIPRSNGRHQVPEQLELTMRSVEAQLLMKQVVIDRRQLPGQKAAWMEILQKRAPAAIRSESVFKDYLHELGLRWRQGARQSEIEPILLALQD